MNITHRPVLLAEAVTALISGPRISSSEASKNLLLIDGTFGRGGHTQALLAQLPSSAKIISFDKDLDAIAVAAFCAARRPIFHVSRRAWRETEPTEAPCPGRHVPCPIASAFLRAREFAG